MINTVAQEGTFMRKHRIAVVLAASLTLSGGLGAQDVSPPPAESESQPITEPRILGRRPVENGDADRAPIPRDCIETWRCLDASAVDSEPAELVEYIPPLEDPDDQLAVEPESESERLIAPNGATGQPAPVRRVTRASRGVRVGPGTAPWMAQIQRPVRVNHLAQRDLDWEDRQFCGGAYIAPGWIVTAAHCLTDKGKPIKPLGYRVRLGVSNIERGETGATYKIINVYQGVGYNGSSYANDIALIQFATDSLTENRRIRLERVRIDGAVPAARQFAGKIAQFYGWGRTERDRPSGPLQFGRIRLLADTDCNALMNSRIALCGQGYGAINATQCKGDSGGPLIWRDEAERAVLVGVVSHNTEEVACGRQSKPGVFTRISAHKAWIERFTGKLP
jgi:Trypsin